MEGNKTSLDDYIAKNLENYSTYHETPINGLTLYDLSEKMPEALEKSVFEWATKNKGFLQIAIRLNKEFDLKNPPSEQTLQELSKLLAHCKFENKSAENVIIPVQFENENWFIKFAGPLRRWQTLNATAICCQKEVPVEKLITYQTPSSAAYNLHYQKIFQQEKIEHVELPPTYLAHVPGRPPLQEGVSDENCFIVQKEVKYFSLLKNNLDDLHHIPEAAIKNLLTLMVKGPLFDLEHNLAFNRSTKNFIMVDLEQSWGESGYFFFQRNDAMIRKKIGQSILGFLSLLLRGSERYPSENLKKTYNTFCTELDKYSEISREFNQDIGIALKRSAIEEIFDEDVSLKNKSLKSE